MHPELNPYRPGSGLRPPALIGREAEIDRVDLIRAQARLGRTNRPLVLHGLRGVGKTVLLNEFRNLSLNAGWLTVDLEGSKTNSGAIAVRHRLARGLVAASRRLARGAAIRGSLADALGSIASFSVNLGVVSAAFVTPANTGRADSGEIEVDLSELVEDLAATLQDRKAAFALFIDEMQDIDDELLTALLAVQHKAGQEELPFYVFGAGLPSLPAILSERRSYAERLFDFRSIGSLDHAQALEALVGPARDLGASFEDGAADLIVDASDGYPFFIQTFGEQVWINATRQEISVSDAKAGIDDGRAALDAGFYPSRWDRASTAERGYLRAMALDEGAPSRTSVVADRMGTSPSGASQPRQSLISKGVIYAKDRGIVAFTVPGMAEYIQRQHLE